MFSFSLSKSQGGHQQIDARIAYNEIDLVIMFSDPNDTDPWEDQRIMRTLRLCDSSNVPCATNLASAEMLILGLQRGDLDWRMMMKNKRSDNFDFCDDAEAVPAYCLPRERAMTLKGPCSSTGKDIRRASV